MNLNKYGVNAQLTFNRLPDRTMKKLGFTAYNKSHWYKCIMLDDNISFNISISKSGEENEVDIAVLDERFLQPYNYQYMLAKNPKNEFCSKIKFMVEAIMEGLQEAGLINGFEKDMYIKQSAVIKGRD